MQLNELYEPAQEHYQDQADDHSKLSIKDMRKTKLTLRQLNKLRRLIDVRNFELQQNLNQIKAQYAKPPEPML